MRVPIQGYEGLYEADSEGCIVSVRHGGERVLKSHKEQRKRGASYHKVGLSKEGVKTTHYVHILVNRAFHGEPRPGEETRHLDGNTDHNQASNLAWGTRSRNMLDAVEHGTHSSNREKTHCKQGHEFTPENTMPRAGMPNARYCRTCHRAAKNAWAAKKREKRSG